ncbi:odorant receptor 131-2-like [Hyla sarda]|uniref:odorant receptor 131-2-like n=1 Tax=Hyla sarda TaxID=327740 RepID=UPI0024C43A3E|nr:odorant receptor 131-2-like [Hyla sarda]
MKCVQLLSLLHITGADNRRKYTSIVLKELQILVSPMTLQDSSAMLVNFTVLHNNVTQISTDTAKISETTKMIFLIFTIFSFCLFLYFMTVLLMVYFTTPRVRDNSRYIFFAHMLINDTTYLILGLFLLLAYKYKLYFPVSICHFLITLIATSFLVTPYNLAAMALERYIAICFPLRHALLCTVQRTYLIIVMIWFVGLLPSLVDFIILILSVERDFFSQSILCKQDRLIVRQMQYTVRSISYIGSLFLVALLILVTYIKVMLVAWKSGSGKSTASRAGKTLLLHTLQLILSMMSLTSTVTESYSGDYIDILILSNFLMFMCFPRTLSPLIYGVRDEVFMHAGVDQAHLVPKDDLEICPSHQLCLHSVNQIPNKSASHSAFKSVSMAEGNMLDYITTSIKIILTALYHAGSCGHGQIQGKQGNRTKMFSLQAQVIWRPC